jgi:hypothetical protein
VTLAAIRRESENPFHCLIEDSQPVQVLPPNSNSINRMMALLPNGNDSWKTNVDYTIPVRPYEDDPSKLEIDTKKFALDLQSGQAMHLVQSEAAYRHQQELQDLYGAIRLITTDMEYVLEDDIQKEMVRQYGIDIPLRIRCQWSAPKTSASTLNEQKENVFECSSGQCQRKATSRVYSIEQLYIPKKSVEDEYADHVLGQYRLCISKHIHDPSVRQKAFFLKNNIVVPGYQIGDIVDTQRVPLVPFANNGVEITVPDSDITHESKQDHGTTDSVSSSVTTPLLSTTSLANIIDNAVSLGKQRLIILSGSIT